MDPLLVVVIGMAVVFFAVAVYMEWLGLLSIVMFRSGPRHSRCGHRKLTPANEREMCWRCRHAHLAGAMHPFRHVVTAPLADDQPR